MKNIRTISSFISKIIRNNILFVLTILVINYQFITSWYYQINLTQASFNELLSLRVYTCVLIGALTVLNVMFYMQKNYDSIKILCKNNFEYFLGVCLSVVKINLIFSCIPFFYAIIYSIIVRPLSLTSIITIILTVIFEWIIPLTTLSIIVSFISIIINNVILKFVLVSGVIYITSTKMLDISMRINNIFMRNIFKTLNIFDDQTYAEYTDSLVKDINISYILDKLLPLLFSIMLILIAYIILNNFKQKYIKSMLVVVVFTLIFLLLNYISTNIVTYRDYDFDYTRYFYKQELNNFEIKTHKIKADFKNNSQFESNIIVVNTTNKPQSSIDFVLDRLFKVKEVKINSKSVDFNQNGDQLTINSGISIYPKQEVQLTINYSGYLNVLTSWNQTRVVANSRNISLPPNSFIWYPKVNQSNEIQYKLELNSRNKVYSNLTEVNKKNTLFTSKYTFNLKSKDIAIFSGAYNESIKNGIKIVYPESVNYNELIENNLNFLKASKSDLKKIKSASEYVENIDEIINLMENKKIKTIVITKLDIPNYTYRYENIDYGIQINAWCTGDTLILNEI